MRLIGAGSNAELSTEAKDALEWLGFGIDVNAKAGSLTVAQQPAVEIAKALHRKARVVLLDEPAATLPAQDVKRLLEVLRTLQARGVSLIYISHRFEEVFEICGRISVLRDGDQSLLYCCHSRRTHDMAGNPHMLSVGIDLLPALHSHRADAEDDVRHEELRHQRRGRCRSPRDGLCTRRDHLQRAGRARRREQGARASGVAVSSDSTSRPVACPDLAAGYPGATGDAVG